MQQALLIYILEAIEYVLELHIGRSFHYGDQISDTQSGDIWSSGMKKNNEMLSRWNGGKKFIIYGFAFIYFTYLS